MRVLSVVGNRPQFIKSAPLSVALRDAGIDEVLLHTGQHYDPELSQVFFDELGLAEPKYRLGLQTADPEEMRPRIADTIAAERPDAGRIEVVGDVMADASLRFAPIARERSNVLETLGAEPRGYVAATVHREANVQPERLRRILEGLGNAREPVVLAAHPRTRRTIAQERLRVPANVHVIDSLGYLDFAALVSQARVVATDSGGLQKEAYWFGIPCVTLRPTTEWVGTVEAGANVLVDDAPDRIEAAVERARMPAERPALYGDG